MQRKKLSPQARLSAEDSDLFRQSVTGARPLLQDKIAPVTRASKKKARPSTTFSQNEQNLFFFSDGYEGLVSDGGSLSYVQQGDDPRLAGRLKRAEFQPQVVLDLHGLTQLQAKNELAGLLAYCQQQQFNCACVVHGKGLGILARKVPNWLIQHPNVRAFHTAPKSWGKHGALILLLKINQPDDEQRQ
ncbi:endonuclease SmrB [Arsukibacterium sp. UBA3155]|uniref:endonuclease SmrB n=1 Tax=Arsukibacterium sp. UBA3155 TaxID=1946058 RepID=UPI0025BEDA4E|nr:endonuclease SmrB [Arsukibacterium sp. UBA3155]|tara:strand:+ start:40366 stop:40929 length:564 start_codon:yes stop_codon:yes gene_type:complete